MQGRQTYGTTFFPLFFMDKASFQETDSDNQGKGMSEGTLPSFRRIGLENTYPNLISTSLWVLMRCSHKC